LAQRRGRQRPPESGGPRHKRLRHDDFFRRHIPVGLGGIHGVNEKPLFGKGPIKFIALSSPGALMCATTQRMRRETG